MKCYRSYGNNGFIATLILLPLRLVERTERGHFSNINWSFEAQTEMAI